MLSKKIPLLFPLQFDPYEPPPPPGDGRGPPPRPFPPPADFDPGLVRPEEAAIVGAVLVLWAVAVVLFVHRWGKIR